VTTRVEQSPDARREFGFSLLDVFPRGHARSVRA